MDKSTAAQSGERRRFLLSLTAFYTGVHGANGVLLPFTGVWLAARGLDVEQIGLTLACAALTRLLSVPLSARIADRIGSTGRVLRRLAFAALILFPVLSLFYGFSALFPAILIAYFFWNPLMPLADSYGLTGALKRGLHYGRMRLIGSASFIAGSVGAGFAVKAFGVDPLMLMATGFMALMAVSSLYLPRDQRDRASSQPEAKVALRERSFLVLVLAIAFIHSSHALFYSFGTIHYLALGYSDTVAGLLWAVGVVSEIVMFFFASRVMRVFRPETLIAMAAIAGVVRWSFASLDPGLSGQVLLQVLHGGTFGWLHLGALAMLQARVPVVLQASGQALSVVVVGLTMTGATVLSGFAYNGLAGKAYLFMSGLAFAGGLLAALVRGQPQSEGTGG